MKFRQTHQSTNYYTFGPDENYETVSIWYISELIMIIQRQEETDVEPDQQTLSTSENGSLLSVRSELSITLPNNNFTQAWFNFVKAFVGLGVLSAPRAMRHAGVILGSGFMLWSAVLSLYGTNILISSYWKFLKDIYLKEQSENQKLVDEV